MDWTFIFETLAALGFGTAALTYLAKSLLKLYLDRDIEKYKADLKAVHDHVLERLRTDLRIRAFEKETTFAKLHAKRVEVIEELYRHIVKVKASMNDLMSPLQLSGGPTEDEKLIAANTAGRKFVEYYEEHKIYFSEELCRTLQAFSDELWHAWITFGTFGKDEYGVAKERRATRFDAWKKLNGEVATHKADIENAFRLLLGQVDKEDHA